MLSEPNQILFVLIGLRKINLETKTVGESCARKNYSEKFYKFHKTVPLMKSFLDKLQPVPFKEELHHKFFLITFGKLRVLQNSCFKERVIKRKTRWKG